MADIFEIVGRVSLDGIDRAERELNNFTNTGEQSSSKLSKLGGIAKTVGKGLLVGTGAVVTGAIGLVKQVSSSYGSLQQSIGGIETLFGKSAQKVIDNANNAFKTAGMSANDYMQQVTSFSASLLQSLGGDTEKAADAADMALRDMSDNANKMGTSMEAITNAYQGFSKQNYTMLDNLKLGYGGTKTEMERLLADAEKLSGVKYDISNLNDVYQAIHVIQGELGITGTTALEAGATIEGSFGSLGAAWQNFLAGLGNPSADMATIVKALAEAIAGAVKNVTPVIDNMVKVLPTVVSSLVDAVKTMLPTLIETFTGVITEVINAIVDLLPTAIPLLMDCIMTVVEAILTNLPSIIDAILLLISTLISDLSSMMPTLVPLITKIVTQIATSILDNLPTIIEALLSLLNNLTKAVIDALPQLLEAVPQLISQLAKVIIECMPMITMAGIQLFGELLKSLPEIVVQITEMLPEIIEQIGAMFVEASPQLMEASMMMWKTILDALAGVFNSIFKLIEDSFNKYINRVQNEAKVIGDFWSGVWSQIGAFFSNIGQSISNFFSDVVNSVSNWIKGVGDKISQLPESIEYYIGYALGAIARWAIDVGEKAREGAKVFIDNTVKFFSELPSRIKTWLDATAKNISNWFTNTVETVKKWGENFIKTAINTGKNFVEAIVKWFKELPYNISKWLNNTILAVKEWAINLYNGAIKAGKDFFDGIVKWFKEIPDKIKEIGENLIQGLWEGIKSGWDWLTTNISNFCDNVVKGFKDGLGIHSPSRLTAEIGRYLTQGLGVGIDEDDSAEKSIRNKIDSIMGVANNATANIKVGTSVGDIVSESPMQKYQVDFNAQFTSLSNSFDRLLAVVSEYLPNIADSANKDIVIDGNSLAIGMSRKIDSQLGRMAISKGRGNV